MAGFTTEDMALAAVLNINGESPTMELVESKSDRVRWLLDSVDPKTAELIANYERGAARVEPKMFLRSVRHVRQNMFDFINKSK